MLYYISENRTQGRERKRGGEKDSSTERKRGESKTDSSTERKRAETKTR